jgi:hypothetical protein
MKKTIKLLVALTAIILTPVSAIAADHIDSPTTIAEPTADLTDLYAWMTPEADKLNLVMNVNPFAGDDASFSDAVQYVFHINSSEGYGEAQTETLAFCQFPEPSRIQCWIGDDYITGNPNDPAGIINESGTIRVFAGLRNDPFFMEFTGFTNTVQAVIGAASSLDFDTFGCPAVDADTSNVLVGLLQSGNDGAPATDTFAGANILSLVVQVDASTVAPGGPVLGVWASTHRAN